MSDEFFEKDTNQDEAADINSREAEEVTETTAGGNTMEQAGESTTGEGTINESIIPESSVYRYKKPSQEEEKKEAGGSYSFWAEQVTGTGAGQTYENYQEYKENKGFDTSNTTYNQRAEELKQDEKGRKKDGFFHKAGKLVAVALVFGLVAGLAFTGFNEAYYKLNPKAAPVRFSIGDNGSYKLLSSTAVTDGKIAQKTDVTDVIEKTMPSIVQITTTYNQVYNDWFGEQYNQESEGGGSGIIVGKNEKELLIATNNHVVEGADPIKVKFIDGTEAEAIIKGTDSVADIAVISIDLTKIKSATMDKIAIAKLGDSNSVKVGEMAVAIGNALGYGQSTTVGYISAKDREVNVDDKKMVLLQTDAAINPGNSGGALLNLNGEVIGINTVKYASSEVEGMGFAIPISKATPIIDELMSREILTEKEKGYLGVYPEDVTEDVATMYNWPVGVFVKKVISGGSAEKAGIVAGDIITKVNDTEITASTQLKEKVNSYRAGTKITVTVKRNVDGKFSEKTFDVTLTADPQTDSNK
ncbi:serine protease Do [Anaerocolumna jejuensis DSM 15929]|uniref:Serine protease Do n=1 Tax=Anaerocolumna jejuensis DSM 15929 TaxID=1121322 RepID=A0A1M6VAW5_9FIRM|nr:trypsin-like peptidase domain-containing protein [Anaerocolumna jejuensis]SHK78598.1 serine protease Do [Anaerocolumna jejuensis DSM 15929]